jgi:hypothetical protein
MFSKDLRVDDMWFVEFLDNAIREWGLDFAVTFDDGFLDCVVPAAFAANKGIQTTVFVSFHHLSGMAPYSPLPMLRPIDLSFLLESGVRIGSHGMRHEDWTLISDFSAACDIRESYRICSDLYSRYKVPGGKMCIAPPHGSFHRSHVDMCLEAGFGVVYGLDCKKVEDIVRTRVPANAYGYILDGEEYSWPWGG